MGELLWCATIQTPTKLCTSRTTCQSGQRNSRVTPSSSAARKVARPVSSLHQVVDSLGSKLWLSSQKASSSTHQQLQTQHAPHNKADSSKTKKTQRAKRNKEPRLSENERKSCCKWRRI